MASLWWRATCHLGTLLLGCRGVPYKTGPAVCSAWCVGKMTQIHAVQHYCHYCHSPDVRIGFTSMWMLKSTTSWMPLVTAWCSHGVANSLMSQSCSTGWWWVHSCHGGYMDAVLGQSDAQKTKLAGRKWKIQPMLQYLTWTGWQS